MMLDQNMPNSLQKKPSLPGGLTLASATAFVNKSISEETRRAYEWLWLSIWFVNATGEHELLSDKLMAFDAQGRGLPSRMKVEGSEVVQTVV